MCRSPEQRTPPRSEKQVALSVKRLRSGSMKSLVPCVPPRGLGAALALVWLLSAQAREWTSTDGKTLDADFVSATADAVRVKRTSDGREVSLPLARLSEADRDWVKAQKPAAPGASPAAGGPLTGPYAPLVTGDWALSEFKDLPFALHAPKDWSTAKPLPLLVALHGKSDNNENGKQIGDWVQGFAKPERQAKHPCVVLAPLCYQPHGGTGGGWSAKPGEEVIALVKDLVKSLPLDKTRIYVTGHSMGGFGTCHLLAAEPRLFAAGIPMAGCSGNAGTLKRVPLWIFHAADDDVVKPDTARSLAKALERAKGFKYTEFPDGGHGIPGRVFQDDAVVEWLFAQGGKK